jgi:hypothetical protein
LFIAAGVALLAIALILFLILRGPNKGSGVIPSTASKGLPSTASSTPEVKNPTTSDTSKFPASTADSNPPLLDPTGTFVSNHRPSLSGSKEQLSEQSVCNTTVGATCYIKLTRGSTVKTLASQTIGANGTAYWSWNVSDSGLTEGTWTVEAIATLNGQSKTAQDPIDLVVQP